MENPFLVELAYYLRNAYPPFVYQLNPKPVKDYIPVFISHKVTEKEFEEKLIFLKENNYRTCIVTELYSFLKERSIPPTPAVSLTFDDGHKSLYETAFPLLKKYNLTATAFIVPAFIDRPTWATWQEVIEMDKSGVIEFQSHTLEHKKIPINEKKSDSRMSDKPRYLGKGKWETREEQMKAILFDLVQSRKILEEGLHKPVQHLAYPWGIGGKISQGLSRQAGYLTNFCGPIYGIPYNRKGANLYKLVRLKDDYILRLPGNGRKSIIDVFRCKAKRRIKEDNIYQ